MTQVLFRIGVESVLPGKDDWFATIYGCWMGKHFGGAHCLALPHLLPQISETPVSGPAWQVTEGAGEYLFTEDMGSDAAAKFIRPPLGAPDAVSYTFGDKPGHHQTEMETNGIWA